MIPPHERRILEAHVRGCRLSALAFIQQEKPLNEYEERQLKDLIKLRVRGMPLQYLTNSQGFYGREFYVNTAVLVPRPETEGLVELTLKNLPPREEGRRLFALEFGTGSGCIGITLATERKDMMIFASEASRDALAVATENSKTFRAVNLDFMHVSETPHHWQYDTIPLLDLLISNPPYLVMSDHVAADVAEHEPPEALYTPDGDPMFYYRFLAELLEEKLGPSGIGAFEIAEDRGAETALVFETKGFITEVHKDLTERDRYLLVRRKG
ncbi:MAG: peptide chain release factor N(5)-glutamine methyltransferase [Deltaproteobacteria bacterium]|nr:peptide chain release factor N(5)-glutamine methyltransferase [Deltaproteobacteria bacterium]